MNKSHQHFYEQIFGKWQGKKRMPNYFIFAQSNFLKSPNQRHLMQVLSIETISASHELEFLFG